MSSNVHSWQRYGVTHMARELLMITGELGDIVRGTDGYFTASRKIDEKKERFDNLNDAMLFLMQKETTTNDG